MLKRWVVEFTIDSSLVVRFMSRYVWLLELCPDPEKHPFEMTTLGIFEEVTSSDLIGWTETSQDIWVKRTHEGEYFFKRLLTQENPGWMAICNFQAKE